MGMLQLSEPIQYSENLFKKKSKQKQKQKTNQTNKNKLKRLLAVKSRGLEFKSPGSLVKASYGHLPVTTVLEDRDKQITDQPA